MIEKNSTHKKQLKVRIISIIMVLAVMSITYFVISALNVSGFFLEPIKQEAPTYEFEHADYEADIFDDPEYVALVADEFIRYSDGSATVSVFEDNYGSYSEAAQLIFALIHSAQKGDANLYNSCFSESYIKVSGEQGRFTMQQIYDVLILEGPPVRENSYIRTDFEVEYKIRKNNGTLRDDMGSDSVKKQYITVTTNNADKKPLIDSVTVVSLQEKEPRTYNTGNIIAVAVAAALINSGALVAAIVLCKKTKKPQKISDAE